MISDPTSGTNNANKSSPLPRPSDGGGAGEGTRKICQDRGSFFVKVRTRFHCTDRGEDVSLEIEYFFNFLA